MRERVLSNLQKKYLGHKNDDSSKKNDAFSRSNVNNMYSDVKIS